MKLFKSKTMGVWDIGIIKFTMLLIGIAIGSNWSYIFAPYALKIFAIALLIGLFSLFSWLKE